MPLIQIDQKTLDDLNSKLSELITKQVELGLKHAAEKAKNERLENENTFLRDVLLENYRRV